MEGLINLLHIYLIYLSIEIPITPAENNNKKQNYNP